MIYILGQPKKKWNDINKSERQKALESYDLLKAILSQKNFEYIYINGNAVKEQLKKYWTDKTITINEDSIEVKYHADSYKGELNGTKLIGSSCYIQNSFGLDLADLHKKIK